MGTINKVEIISNLSNFSKAVALFNEFSAWKNTGKKILLIKN
tara:strand:+ start:1087 stop:1212 length:126 start_codon:yes stop_codon:yes gene_type:complete